MVTIRDAGFPWLHAILGSQRLPLQLVFRIRTLTFILAFKRFETRRFLFSPWIILQNEQEKSYLILQIHIFPCRMMLEKNTPSLKPSTYTKYAVNRLQSDFNHERKTYEEVTPPRDNMRDLFFTVVGRSIILPQNRL